ncbi:class I SAM-dependent methyltransferase [Fluctibacter halophilus]
MPPPTEWYTDNPRFRISNHANVFARQQLDIGARFLLDNLPDCSGQRIIDLGCGNGVLGLHVLAQWPDSRVTFVDESFMAIASARDNVTGNLQDGLQRSEFLVSNCLEQFSGGQVDRILCNPPFHQQNTITDHIADQMFADARQHLRPGGELRIIGNRHLDYPAKLKRLFGGYTVVAANRKFSILSAIKR